MSPTNTSTALTGAAGAIHKALTAEPGSTSSALALAAGIGQSTAGKALTALEAAGLARRTPGGHNGNRRRPDRWHPTTPSTQPPTAHPRQPHPSADPKTQDDSAPASAQNSQKAGQPEPLRHAEQRPSTAREDDAELSDATQPSPAPCPITEDPSARASQTSPGQPAVAPANGPTATEPAAEDEAGTLLAGQPCPTCGHQRRATRTSAGGPRLAQGQLHQMVLAHLDAHPHQDWTPTNIANALGRSAGAISNALTTMVTRGQAQQTCAKPRRYRTTQAAIG